MLWHCLFAALVVDLSLAEAPGICSVTNTETKTRYVMDRGRGTWVVQEYQQPVETETCCEGYTAKSQKPLKCSPICEPECVKSDCMAPNTCVCYPGHKPINNSTTSCYDVCDSCVNGACKDDELECTCDPGYQRDQTFLHICNPVCHRECVNSTCTAPGTCECFQGFIKDPVQNNICVPHCSENCVFGRCTEPDVCTCFDGYINDKSSPSICMPVCHHPCENGECGAPDSCSCHDGFELHPRDPYHCIAQPLTSTLNYCELRMSKAVMFDDDKKCFVMKDKVIVSSAGECYPLRALSEQLCLQADTSCDLVDCILNFRCSARKINGSNEIHCNLETDDFETETSVISVINGTEWTDVTLVINSYEYFNTSALGSKDQAREWTLHPLSQSPICGQMNFAVGISNCGMITKAPVINSSFVTFLNVFLVMSFLALVGAGVGGFMWARHRRLNNPLNYREGMMSGYDNACYDRQPTELVSDDDSDRDSEAHL